MKKSTSRLQALLLALTAAALPQAALACSCLAYPADEAKAVAMAWPSADAVFLGEVTAVKPGTLGLGRWTSVTVEIHSVWKGVTDDTSVVIKTPSNSAACGYPFRNGETYVVFAERNPDSGGLTTTLCSLNRRARDAEGLMRALDDAKRAEQRQP